MATTVNPEEQQGILGTIQRLRQMLDLEEPKDRYSVSDWGDAFKPMDGIEVLPLDASLVTVLMTDDRRELKKATENNNNNNNNTYNNEAKMDLHTSTHNSL